MDNRIHLALIKAGCFNYEYNKSFEEMVQNGTMPWPAVNDMNSFIHNNERLGCFIGQLSHESAGLCRTVENGNYSAKRILQVFGQRVKTEREAERLAGNPIALFNKVYGNRMGNIQSNDGSFYKGRGYIQLTGRYNFTQCSKAVGIDFKAAPDLLSKPEFAYIASLWYFVSTKVKGDNLFTLADTLNHKAITKAINGGYHGLMEREELSTRAIDALYEKREEVVGLINSADNGRWVKEVQYYCKLIGTLTGRVDGYWGPNTHRAIQEALGNGAAGVSNEDYWRLYDNAMGENST